ncbi:ExbD/TolR family protein [Erythrobacter sp. W53]|uniref:ExbD/TolR family protein n=1 Tax=Erythrobacter sp. W53 TaxID=3425947 RepID=UPI003D768DC3
MRKSLGARRWGERPDRLLKAKRFDHGEPIARLDTRPMAFVFAFLVILIIGTAPPTTHAFTIDLADAAFLENLDTEREASLEAWLVENRLGIPVNKVTISRADEIQWNGQAITEWRLSELLYATLMMQPEPELLFEPDPSASYETAMRALYIIKASGVSKFNFAGLRDHCRFGKSDRPRAVHRTSAPPGLLTSLTLVEPSTRLADMPRYRLEPRPAHDVICPGDN